ncbi:protein kinase domain-containing protein [Kitasatospora sp. NBC_00039]|uniref:serine/threonine protein kinase n=1 Tax=Kitasatospora sp. NBC_00039 TaxID=2903565 RepID=UPI00325522ED
MTGRGAVLGGRYRLTEWIGGGGMGAVWRADDRILGRQVAVKVLHAGLLEEGTFARRFRREAQLLAAISHPGIVEVHDYGESGGADEGGAQGERIAYIVMELVEGRPLDKVLTEGGPMAPEQALGLLATALDALHAAHQQEIVHRDVKPSNLMLGADGRVTVTDFGIARALVSTTLTATNVVIGTALYMAPEQAGGGGVTPASDLYSIGVVCYELLTGTPPFTGESVVEVALKHVQQPAPELPEEFPREVREFVARALAKQPGDRFADAAAMAAAARAAVGDRSVPVAAVVRPVPPAAPEAPAAGAAGVEVARVEPRTSPEPAARRTWRRFLVPIVVPVVVTTSAATVLLVERGPFQSQAQTPGGQPVASVSAPAVSGPPTAGTPPTEPAPTTPPAGETTPGTPPAAQPEATPAPNSGGQPVAPAPNAGGQPVAPAPKPGGGAAAGGTGSSGGSGGSGGTAPKTGGSGGGGSIAGGGNAGGGGAPAPNQPPPPAPAPTQPAPSAPAPNQPPSDPPASKPPTPTVPPGCGGANWGAIVNVADGQQLGLATDSPSAGAAAVMGGTTAYGWVRSAPDPGGWYQIYPCSLSSPALVQDTDFSNQSSQKVLLSPGFSFMKSWSVVGAGASGTYYLKNYMGSTCLTDNGAGAQVTMTTCTPGNKYQQWRIP